ncbi:MAG TPA: hypothetical protein VMF61_05550 [Candidatus Acidoferrales bacterium]|nr:hypothetical protein [Candidatus Acidoferrales bacterium]
MRGATLQTLLRIGVAALLTKFGMLLARYELVAICLFIGGLEFTHDEAIGI